MKIQFDTLAKTIKVEGTVDMGENTNLKQIPLSIGNSRIFIGGTNTRFGKIP